MTEQDESDFFEESERRCWEDHGEHWWSAPNCSLVVGLENQRLAFFPAPVNATDPSHGYPVTTYRDRDYTVPENVIALWEQGPKPYVDVRTAKKLRLKQI